MTTTEQWTEAEARKIILQQSDAIVRLISERDTLRSELAACHKTIIDAMAALGDGSIRRLSDNVRTLSLCDRISTVETILDSAPEPSDETLRLIEETDTGGDDA